MIPQRTDNHRILHLHVGTRSFGVTSNITASPEGDASTRTAAGVEEGGPLRVADAAELGLAAVAGAFQQPG